MEKLLEHHAAQMEHHIREELEEAIRADWVKIRPKRSFYKPYGRGGSIEIIRAHQEYNAQIRNEYAYPAGVGGYGILLSEVEILH